MLNRVEPLSSGRVTVTSLVLECVCGDWVWECSCALPSGLLYGHQYVWKYSLPCKSHSLQTMICLNVQHRLYMKHFLVVGVYTVGLAVTVSTIASRYALAQL